MLLLSDDEINRILTPGLAVSAIERALEYEAEGKVAIPARLNVEFDTGWLRVMPGAIKGVDEWGVMGCKVMNLDKKRGLHYIILLFDTATGTLLSILDGAAITQIRTGAVSAVVGKKTVQGEVPSVGMIGTGYEARGQLAAAQAVFPALKSAKVFSRKEENRKVFAVEMSQKLGIDVHAVSSAEEAAADQKVVIMATKSPQPVIDGHAIRKDAVVLSIGSTRLDLRELDNRTMERAAWVIVDNTEQVMAESADVQEGLKQGILSPERFIEAHRLGSINLPKENGRDLIVFKSSGTALQDLSVASQIYRAAVEQKIGQSIDFPHLKKFK